MGGRGSGCQTSSFDGSTARPAQSWARSGTRNIGYIAMDKLKQRVCHAVSYKKNIGVLQTKIQVLMEEIAEVQSVLMSEENYSMDGVQHWLSQADEILKEANGIVEGRNNMADKKRMCSPCWDPTSSWETGEMLRDIDNILEDRKGLDLSSYFCGLSYCKKLQSRENMLQEILEDLMGIHINVIGIYGMIGVGKTVLSKELAKRVRNNKLYDDIVMVLVSEPLDVKLIQAQIANKIGLQLSEADDEETRAHILYNKIDEKVVECGEETNIEPIQQAKILVILDGMWSVSDLRKVGIPYKQEGKSRCKVVLISRNADVCKEMGAEKNFLVECLNLDEAKILFQESLKDKIESMEITLESERYEYVENVILMKCGGLPLMINSLACTLRSMSQSNWEVVADQMERQSLLEVDEAKEVPCAILELCNRFIQINGREQKLFLLCCLIQQGGDVPLEKLMRYGIGFGLFEVDSLASVDEQINSWVHELKSLSLLLESEKPHHVKMHHLIQDVAVLALSQGDNILPVLVEAGTGWHTRDSYENCVAISMAPDSNYKCLNGLELPKLEALWLKGKPSLSLPVPGTFFQGMQNLKILEMYGMTCELPSCLGDMKNLVTLHLESCCIKDEVISMICANLARLEVLSLRGSTFETLPDEIGNLTNLRVLDLTDCTLDTFPVAGVAKLNRLRELYLSGSNTEKWSTGYMEKWAHLPLEAFEIEIADTSKVSPGALSFPNLRRFKIVISDTPGMPPRRYADQDPSSYSRAVLINKDYYPILFEERHWIDDFLPRTEYLQIRGVSGLVKGIGELNIQGFSQLKNLYVEDCWGMKCILDATYLSMIQQTQIFPELQVLTLRYLGNLTSVCCPQPCYSLLPRLRELILEHLDRLCTHVLPIQLAVTLRVLEVSDCPRLLHIFEIDETDHGASVDELPFLEKLELRKLDALQDVCNKKIKFPSLKEIHLDCVDQIEKLWDFLGSKDPCFGNLKYMTISGCFYMESLFPSHIVNSLSQLEKLEVSSCSNMKEVITSTNVGVDTDPSTMITAPKLQILKLERLSNLHCFYRGCDRLKFPMLREFELIDLRQMTTFSLPDNHSCQTESTVCFDGEIDSVSLEHPQVSEIDFELLQRHSETTTFPNLSRLALKDLPNLKALPNINSKTLRILRLEGMDSLRVLSSVQPSYKPSLSLLMSWELEELTLTGFESVDELFYNEKSVDIRHQFDHVKLFISLRKLEVRNLRPRKMIPWNVLTNLSSLIIYDLKDCTSLISTALLLGGGVLPLLEYMKIGNSESLEAIISREEQEDEDVLKYGITLFPSLRHIELYSLSKLESFSMGSYEAHFPSLETLVVTSCFRMRSFSLGTLRTPRLKHVEVGFKTMEADTFDDLNALVNAGWRSARERTIYVIPRSTGLIAGHGYAGASTEDLGKGLYAADATAGKEKEKGWVP